MLRARSRVGQATGILFGRERFGLSNEEVGRADAIVTFPVDPEYASLNIAQAVLLMSYEWMKSGLATETDTAFSAPEAVPAERQHVLGLLDHLEAALSARGYFRPAAKKEKMVDGLRAVFMRPRGMGYPARKQAADQPRMQRQPGGAQPDASEPDGND